MRVGIVLAVRGRHEWVNQTFAQMVGRSGESLIGETAQVLHPDADAWERFGAKSRAALLDSGAYLGEHQLRRSDGELFWAEISGTCLYDKNPGAGVIWTYLDSSVPRKPLAQLDEMPPAFGA
jgi:PAS domain S-box-containing protein